MDAPIWSAIFWSTILPVVAIVGWVVVAVVNSLSRARVREMEVRERIAMIERGLVPAPETDPAGFDRAMKRFESATGRRRPRSYGRYRRGGISLIGVGLGLMVLLGALTGEPSIGIGIGGFLAILGVAFFVNSLVDRYDDSGAPPDPPKNP